ncbi:unnamed protein product [Anisakis simplex]|uniref:Uncharacterized protein n=1 Tax=Anisakis simplex TaxID=6269 RepID=A0A158PPL2_ANISI|nr:unnamed protein product [Anisakis simplex]
MKTANKMGIETVAVYSDADRNALHTKTANYAFRIGEAPSLKSYLNMEIIIDTAIKSKCLIFVGPPAKAIEKMGAKNISKQIMGDANVPIIKGYHAEQQDDDTLHKEALKIGYPVMLKAVYGGGGKGMRIAWNDAEFREKLESARSEAQKAFGNNEMIIEKFIERPRHVEVQAPAPGVTMSTRRRLGESAVRAARAVGYVGAGTVEFIMDRSGDFYFMEMNTRLQVEHPISEAITGTDLVEWQLRVAQGERLPLKQDEIPLNGHAIEARVYAEDTKAGFIPIAVPDRNRKVLFDLWSRDTELRLSPIGNQPMFNFAKSWKPKLPIGMAPDSAFGQAPPQKILSIGTMGAACLHGVGKRDFMLIGDRAHETNHEASLIPGHLKHLSFPNIARIDTGVVEGDEVSVHYDPMIAKVIVWSEDREKAISKLSRALQQTHIAGLATNVSFVRNVLNHPEFIRGNVYTEFIADHEKDLFGDEGRSKMEKYEGVIASLLFQQNNMISSNSNPYLFNDYFRLNMTAKETVELDGEKYELEISNKSVNIYNSNNIDSSKINMIIGEVKRDNDVIWFTIHCDGERIERKAVLCDDKIVVFGTNHHEYRVPKSDLYESEIKADNQLFGCAPMPGVIEKILVKVGEKVSKGQALIVMVAMKMEYIIRSGLFCLFITIVIIIITVAVSYY